jgi:hypothetical protein
VKAQPVRSITDPAVIARYQAEHDARETAALAAKARTLEANRTWALQPRPAHVSIRPATVVRSVCRITPKERRELYYRQGLTEPSASMTLAAYSPEASTAHGRIFLLPNGEQGSTADWVQVLVDRGYLHRTETEPLSAEWLREDDALQGRVNNFLLGHGFRVRSTPRDLGIGNTSPNRVRTGANPKEG